MAKRNLPQIGAIPFDPGERNRPVTIQQLTESVGTGRVPVETWTTLAAKVWMARRDMRSGERFAAAQISATVDTRWEMAYRADMDPELVDVPKRRRLVAHGVVYDIAEASVIEGRAGIELVTAINRGATP